MSIKHIKAAVFLAALGPVLRLLVLGMQDSLSANPGEFITRSTGTWSLVFLCLTLTITPLRRLTGWNEAIKLRRMLGLFTFFYASLHFMTFIWIEHFFDWPAMVKDVVKRPFITVGFTAFVLLIPLAVTSTHAWVRRLGGKGWQRLHRLIYGIAVLAILHFWWHKAGKNDFTEPAIYVAVVALLFGARLVHRARKRMASRHPLPSHKPE